MFCCAVAQSCLTLCDLKDCSALGLPVLYHLLEHAQAPVLWVGDTIQPSHLLLSPSSAFYISQHQGLFQWISSSHQVAKELGLQLQHQSFQWINIQDWFTLGLTSLISLQSKGVSRVFSKTIVQASVLWCSAFFMTQLSYPYMTTGKT